MNTPRYAAAAARLLARHLPQTVRSVGTVERARGVATIELAMRKRSRRRAVVATVALLGVAATVALATRYLGSDAARAAPGQVAMRATPTGVGAQIRADGSTRRLGESTELRSGQNIETPSAGGASVRLSTGTEIQLAGSTAFRIDSQSSMQRFSLQHGQLSAHVAKLAPGQRFVLTTPDAEVEVRGTRFVVRVLAQPESCGEAARTRLEVSEGIVEVRRNGRAANVRAGEVWPTDCAPKSALAAPKDPAAPAPVHAAPSASPTSLRHAADAAPSVKTDDSPLTAQNDLFAEGVALRRQGDVRGALRAYQALIARYPKSPLAENAMVERMRLLASSRDAAAGDEARRYLARYPHGFAVVEARHLVKVE